MHYSLEQKSASLSVGEFASFALGPHDVTGGPSGLWRAQLGQHWHNELRARTEAAESGARFEVPIEGRLVHRGWTFTLNGRIDQIVGATLREIKSVTRPLPAAENDLRADYPDYFRQLAAYLVLIRVNRNALVPDATLTSPLRGELVFVEASSGLVQTIALSPFDEALVHHQLDAIVEFLNLRTRAADRRRNLRFQSPFTALRPGQENIQAELDHAFGPADPDSATTAATANPPPRLLLFEAPTGYGKTGCVLEFALRRLRSGQFARLIWLTGKSTGQLHVVETLRRMAAPATCHVIRDNTPVTVWQVRPKSEHCVNHTFHCLRDSCDYLKDGAERWPQSGLARFYLEEDQPRDLATLQAAGREARICPYEITRTALAFNDVWIGDFNYVFAPDNRGVFFDQPGFDPAETLLVVDEAHNLPARVADAHSHAADGAGAFALAAELDHLLAPAPLQLALADWCQLLGSLPVAESLDPVTEAEVHDLLKRLATLVETHPLDYAALGPKHSEALWQFGRLLEFVESTELTKLLWSPRPGELRFTCLDAAPAIGSMLGCFGGAILMSATLHPLDAFRSVCGITGGQRAPETVPAPATPPACAVLRAATPWRDRSYDVAADLRVDTSFKQRAQHHGTTAETIGALHRAARGPVAVFFPSYAYAESVLRAAEHTGDYLRIALQPRLRDLAAQGAWVEENLALADALFLVLGSSFAEGIDMLGGRVTHALVVGPALPEVNAVQKARLAALTDLGRDASFRRVYQVPGLQKVNQALGRLVRAPGHRAKVLLHCRRFADTSYASLLAPEYQLYREIATTADLTEWLGAAE